MLLHFSEAFSLWYAGYLVATGQASFSDVIKVFLILIFSSFYAAEALEMAPDLAKGGIAVASLFRIMDRETKIEPDDLEGEKGVRIRGDIELKQVTMAYPSRPDVIVLRNMTLKVIAGQSLALVGASGSGKSSIVSLIERFYNPSSGSILIDGKDIKQYNLKFLRQHIALVQQEPALFASSIHENILYGRPEATQTEVIEAARAANAHTFISSLPEGYDTLVGEGGIQLSGGQKQRVAIARAVLKDPTIFLLDEATSALDAGSEQIVQEVIDRLMKGRTTIMVAHRLSTIRGKHSLLY
jgi:ATP-binding cassette subfamily B (MDR/TAP) protein 1